MKFKKSILFIILFQFGILFTNFQQSIILPPLKELKNAFKNAKDVSIEYNYKVEGKSNNVKFFIKKNKYYAIVGKEYKIIFDGKNTHNINLEDKEVSVSSKEIKNILTFNKIMNLINSSNYSVIKSDKNFEQVKLTIDKDSHALININKRKKSIDFIKQYHKNTQVSTAIFTKYTLNQNLSASLFQFNKNNYKEYYITNLD